MGVTFTRRAVRRISRAVRDIEARDPNDITGDSGGPILRGPYRLLEGWLNGDLLAPANVFNPTTQTMSVLRFAGNRTGFHDTGRDVLVVNRNPGFTIFQSITAPQSMYLIVGYINGEWRPIAGGGTIPQILPPPPG